MKYKITDISEEDYGCEGIPDGKEPECIVTAENEINDRNICYYGKKWCWKRHTSKQING